MKQHNVDVIGGDFNMSAFSTVGDVFSDPEFSAPGKSFLGAIGALEAANRECTGFSHYAEATIRVACGFTFLGHDIVDVHRAKCDRWCPRKRRATQESANHE